MKSVTLQQIYNLSRKYVFSLLKHNKVQFDNNEKIKNDDGYINNRYEATILFFNAGLFNFDIEDLSEGEIMRYNKEGKKDKNIEKIFDSYLEGQKEGLFFQDDSVILKPRFKELYISSMKQYREDDDDINFYFDSIFLELDDEKDCYCIKLEDLMDEENNLTEEYESDEDPEEVALEEEVINDGNTGEDQALKWTSELGNLNLVKKLLDDNQNIKTDEALKLASENDHSEIVELLKSSMKNDYMEDDE